MPSGMTLVNMALVLLPFLCNVMAVVLAPDRKREYILRPRTPLPQHIYLRIRLHIRPQVAR